MSSSVSSNIPSAPPMPPLAAVSVPLEQPIHSDVLKNMVDIGQFSKLEIGPRWIDLASRTTAITRRPPACGATSGRLTAALGLVCFSALALSTTIGILFSLFLGPGGSLALLSIPGILLFFSLCSLVAYKTARLNLNHSADLEEAKKIAYKLPFLDLINKFSLEDIVGYELLTTEELRASFRNAMPEQDLTKFDWAILEERGLHLPASGWYRQLSLADILIYQLIPKETLHNLFFRALQNQNSAVHARQDLWPLYQRWGILSAEELEGITQARTVYQQAIAGAIGPRYEPIEATAS